jgi:hypothetical protein
MEPSSRLPSTFPTLIVVLGGVVDVGEVAGADLDSLQELLDITAPHADDPADPVGRQLAGVEQAVDGAKCDTELLGQRRDAEPVLAGRLRHAGIVEPGG